MDRKVALEAARAAHANPAHAQQWAEVVLRALRDPSAGMTKAVPPGYLYAGSHNLIARRDNFGPEALPENAQGALVGPIGWTSSQPVTIKVPFDVAIEAVSAWAIPIIEGSSPDLSTQLISSARDGRDLFSVAWGINGQSVNFTTGDTPLMIPACSACGTRQVPKDMYWELQRNDVIQVWFRNITNALVASAFGEENEIRLNAVVCFRAINKDGP